MWLAKDYNASESIRLQYEPLRLVVIQHTASSVCYEFAVCAAELRNIQHAFIKDCDYDIPWVSEACKSPSDKYRSKQGDLIISEQWQFSINYKVINYI